MWNQQDLQNTKRHRDPQTVGAPQNHEANLGISVVVRGEVTGSEDLILDGRVEGRIHLPDHMLTIGPNAHVEAEVVAKIVIIFGSVVGSISAGDKVEIRRGASVEGDLICVRVVIQEGAHFCGKGRVGRWRGAGFG
jgi:cytoskeletal protein CcmA (bactofilin family)